MLYRQYSTQEELQKITKNMKEEGADSAIKLTIHMKIFGKDEVSREKVYFFKNDEHIGLASQIGSDWLIVCAFNKNELKKLVEEFNQEVKELDASDFISLKLEPFEI